MTLEEFYDALKENPDSFTLEQGMIRGTHKGLSFCPITWVAYCKSKNFYMTGSYKLAAEELCISELDTKTIVSAADTTPVLNCKCDSCQPLVRDRILQALGLEVQSSSLE